MIKEITPLTPNDCFTIFSRIKTQFDFPLHFHEEYEMNLILNANGAKRIVGDHISVIDDVELVLVGPNLPHVWLTHECTTEITEVTIQWHQDLFDEKFLKRNQMSFIRQMFDKSLRGISFNRDTVIAATPRLLALKNSNGFNSVLELLSILNDLSMSKSMSILSDSGFSNVNAQKYNSRRLEKAFEFMNNNYDKDISLKDLAKLANMTD
ncbi:MAG: AraC family transcriptional regulator, partial [Pedobacter sp.]